MINKKNIYFLLSFFTWIFIPAVLSVFNLFAQSPSRVDSLEKKLPTAIHDTNRIIILIELANNYSYNDTKKAEIYLKEILSLSESLSYIRGTAKANSIMGRIAEDDSRYSEAIVYFNKSLNIYYKLNDQKKISSCLNKIGDVYWWLADYQRSLENYFNALKINERINNKNGIAECYRNIGWVYYRQQNFNQSLTFFQKSLLYFRQTGDSISVGKLYSDMGAVYGSIKNHKMSLEFFLKSFEILKNTNSKSGVATIYDNLAIAYSDVGDYKLAKQYAIKSAGIFEELEQKNRMSEAYHTLGEIYYKTNQFDSAKYFEDKSLALASQLKFGLGIKIAYNMLAKINAGLKKYKEAYQFFRKYSDLNDSLLEDESVQQVSQIQTLYESEKKEQQIYIQNLQIEKQNADIKRQKMFLFFSVGGMLIFLIMAFIIWREYKAKKKTNKELAIQKTIVDLKNKDITDSINYAKRIQDAVFSEKEIKYRLFPDSFVLFKPRDIVSGDFYWFAEKNGKRFIAAVDCTGHGVPGAFMSIIGNHLLNEIVLEKGMLQPAEILNHLHKGVRTVLKQEEQKQQAQDGMDIALVSLSVMATSEGFGIQSLKLENQLYPGTLGCANCQLEYAGANRPLYWVSGSTLNEIKPDKFSIGGDDAHENKKFANHCLNLKNGDVFYISSDGYADQFGEVTGKKLMNKNLRQLLLANFNLPMAEQEKILDSTIEKWKGSEEQTDDVLVIGVRI